MKNHFATKNFQESKEIYKFIIVNKYFKPLDKGHGKSTMEGIEFVNDFIKYFDIVE